MMVKMEEWILLIGTSSKGQDGRGEVEDCKVAMITGRSRTVCRH